MFELRAVRMIAEQKPSVAEVGRRLGVTENRRHDGENAVAAKGVDAFPGLGHRPRRGVTPPPPGRAGRARHAVRRGHGRPGHARGRNRGEGAAGVPPGDGPQPRAAGDRERVGPGVRPGRTERGVGRRRDASPDPGGVVVLGRGRGPVPPRCGRGTWWCWTTWCAASGPWRPPRSGRPSGGRSKGCGRSSAKSWMRSPQPSAGTTPGTAGTSGRRPRNRSRREGGDAPTD